MPQSQSQARHEFPEITVFTGDLVGSSKLAPDALSEAMQVLEQAFYRVSRLWNQQRPGSEPRFSRFRGDGWQCIGPGRGFALRGALILRAHLGELGRAFDTRISIGIGSGWLTDAPNLEMAAGPAFELSGRGLDGMGHARRFAVAWEDPPKEAPLLQAIVALSDEISRNWTPGQAKVFSSLLMAAQRPSQESLARDLDITQQTVASHLAGGGDWALHEGLKAWEAWQ